MKDAEFYQFSYCVNHFWKFLPFFYLHDSLSSHFHPINLKALSSTHYYFNDMFVAEKFQCPNKEDYVYFRFGEKLELQHEFDTLLVGSLENGKILNSKRYGQGFLEYGDHFMGYLNDGSILEAALNIRLLKLSWVLILVSSDNVKRYGKFSPPSFFRILVLVKSLLTRIKIQLSGVKY